jgi:hypothetical protein
MKASAEALDGIRPGRPRRPSGSATILLVVLLSGVAGCAGEPKALAPRGSDGTSAGQVSGRVASGEVPIVLPELLAIELPVGTTQIAPDDSPLRELLASAAAGGLGVTHDLTSPIGPGATEVTWTAWESAPGESRVRATRRERIHVFPSGHTPVGLTSDDRGTVGNQSPKVTRDASGKAHMVWLDTGRPGRGTHVMYRRAATDPRTGAVTWETDPLPVSDRASAVWNSYPVIDASATVVHIAWAGPSTVHYRRVVRSGDSWTFEPIRDTRVPGPGEDWGPGLTARSDAEIHLLTPAGHYALSRDGGRTWNQDRVPIPRGVAMKGPALAVDARGNAHVTFTGLVRTPAGGFTAYGKQHGGYWEVRYVRRRAGGGWEDAQNVLAGEPAWRDGGAQADVLVDFIDVAVDRAGHIHVAWHGSANTRAYSYDETFYVRRRASGVDTWDAWGPVQALHPLDPASGDFFSFGPSLTVDDDSGIVLAVLFVDRVPGAGLRFDSTARVLRDGRLEGPAIPLTRTAREAVEAGRPREAWSTWFPCAAPRVFRDADGRAWLDVLQTVVTSPGVRGAAHYIVYQRREITSLVGARP